MPGANSRPTYFTVHNVEAAKVDAMVRTNDWAIANDVDVLTDSDRAFTSAARPALDAAVERAIRAGIVTAFVHYPHAGNLLPGWIGPRTGDEREPAVNILQFDCSQVFVPRRLRWQRGKATGIGNHPFLSISSMSPVTAGLVALLRSANPSLTPAAVKELLVASSRPLAIDGWSAARVADAHAALLRCR